MVASKRRGWLPGSIVALALVAGCPTVDGGGPDGLGFHFADPPDTHEGEVILDFVLLNELE